MALLESKVRVLSDLPTWLVPGVVVDGKYEVVRFLGKGGMGAVCEAKHTTIGGRVALKVLLESERTAEATTRFLREAKASFSIPGEHVARVLDAGTAPNGEPYLVLEYLEGSDLSKVLAARGPLPIAEAVELIAQAAAGLSAAHGLGIVHRDVKPANVFLTHRADGTQLVKILDFGIAKAADPFQPQLTETTAAFGTLPYMSPEQVKASRDVDARADIYSLGVVLFELLTARPLFSAPSAAELVVAILHQPAPPLRMFRLDAPHALEAVIARATSKVRDERFASAEAFATAARQALTAWAGALESGGGSAAGAPPIPNPFAATAAPASPMAITSFASPNAATAAPPYGAAPAAMNMPMNMNMMQMQMQMQPHQPHQQLQPHGVYRAAPMMMPMQMPMYGPRPSSGGGKALIGTGGVVTTGGLLAFVAAAIPGVVNGAEIGTAIGIGVAACVVGGSLLLGGFSLLKR